MPTVPQTTPPGGHRTAGLRAARAYARIDQQDLADLLQMSIRDYRRVEAGDKQLDADQRAVIAERCNVPMWLVDVGFANAIETSGTIPDRIAQIEALITGDGRLANLEEELRKLTARLAVVEAEATRRTGGTGRTSEGHSP